MMLFEVVDLLIEFKIMFMLHQSLPFLEHIFEFCTIMSVFYLSKVSPEDSDESNPVNPRFKGRFNPFPDSFLVGPLNKFLMNLILFGLL